jgi:hypothetical protein
VCSRRQLTWSGWPLSFTVRRQAMFTPQAKHPDRFGRGFVLFGLGLFCVFVAIARWYYAFARSEGLFGHLLPLVLTMVVVVTTASTLIGTAALLRRAPSGSVSFLDVAFVVLGLLTAGAGVWVTSSVLLEFVLGR